jgi:hypothetical protein
LLLGYRICHNAFSQRNDGDNQAEDAGSYSVGYKEMTRLT